MKHQIRFSLLILMLVSFMPAYAADGKEYSNFIEHGLSMSRAQTAFYMFGQTEGQAHYKKEYEQHLLDAGQHLDKLKKTHPEVGGRLSDVWNNIRPLIKYDFDEYAGYYVPGLAQGEWRRYLNTYYTEYKALPKPASNARNKLINTQLQMEIVMARFFDLASSPFIDEGSFEVEMQVVDSPKMAVEIRKDMISLLGASKDPLFKSDMKAISNKWKFIEECLLNSQKKPAFMMVYFNKKRIEKLFKSSGDIMAKNDF